MPVVKIEPTKDHPVPYDTSDEDAPTLLEKLAVAGNTAELQEALRKDGVGLKENLGASLEVDTQYNTQPSLNPNSDLKSDLNLTLSSKDAAKQAALLREVLEKKNKTGNLKNPVVALGAAEFIRQYGQTLAFDAAQTRAAITTKLMEIANCGDPKYELRALELLGKHSDIGLFTERSEITINYKSPEALEEAIKERVKRLLNAEIIDITPLAATLEDEEDEGTHYIEAETEPEGEAQKETEDWDD